MGEKIKGKTWYFGSVSDPEAALQKYLDEVNEIQAGRDPRKTGVVHLSANELTVAELCNLFLERQERRIEAGEVSRRHFTDTLRSCCLLVSHFGKFTRAHSLRAADFAAFKATFPATWGSEKTGNEIQRIRTGFKWAVTHWAACVPLANCHRIVCLFHLSRFFASIGVIKLAAISTGTCNRFDCAVRRWFASKYVPPTARNRIAEFLASQQRFVGAAAIKRLPPMRHGEETHRYLHGFKNEASRGMSNKKGWLDWTSQTWLVTISFRDADLPERRLAIRKDYEMGDKGGKKDKEKSKKQKADKQGQKTKGKLEKPQPK